MPLMITIQPWVFITTCWSRQYDFNLVHHPTPEKQFFFLFTKKRPQAGFEPRTSTTNPEHTHALDRSAIYGCAPSQVKLSLKKLVLFDVDYPISRQMSMQIEMIHTIFSKQWSEPPLVLMIPLRAKRVGGVFWNQAQKNFTHPYTEYPWVSVTLWLCHSVANNSSNWFLGE